MACSKLIVFKITKAGAKKSPPGKPEGLQSIAMKNKLLIKTISIPII